MNGRFKSLVDKGEIVMHVAHTQNLQKAREFRAELHTLFPNISVVFVDPLSLSVSCHIGPGSLAVAVTRYVK